MIKAFPPAPRAAGLVLALLLAVAAALPAGLRSGPGATGPTLTARDLVLNLKNKTFSGEPTDLQFDGAGLTEMLAKFQEISGLVFHLDPAVDPSRFPPRRYNFLGNAWDRALDSILSGYGLALRLKGDEIWIGVYVPPRDKTVSAFLIGSVTAGCLALLVTGILARRKRRRRAQGREQKISLDPEAVENAVQRLTYMFQVEKIYRNGRMTLDSLSERLGLQPHQLSGIVNNRMGRSFTELVADYRVDEVKKRLSDPDETANILNIAYDAGFGTKASFNRIFKDRTGLTPSEFRRKTAPAK